jgi:hypothetical protein
MKTPLVVLVVAIIAASCQGSSSGGSPSPSPRAQGVEGLIADLRGAGAAVTTGASFAPDPLTGQGVVLCVAGEPVRLYAFASAAERAQTASRIDPTDPSKVGTSIVEWIGNPRFWQRDRILVLYLGRNAATETLLRSVLGEPFAKGVGGRTVRPDTCS